MTDQLMITRLLTRKDALAESRIDQYSERAELADGEVRLKLDRFALTTNNITYAAFGDAMNYWKFFPTGEVDWGHMPVWGFADVVASTVDGVEVGERFYGYFPIADSLLMKPERVALRGFYDGAEHRQGLPTPYNHYSRVPRTETTDKAREDYEMLFRPLFFTSYMLADFLEDNNFFGASQIVFSSASSKTAYGTAFCLKNIEGIELVGVTSGCNLGFVQQIPCYDHAVTYEQLASLDPAKPTLYVDFSGNDALRKTIHDYFGRALTYDCYAGSATNVAFLHEGNLPGPTPTFFFAPVQIKKRNVDWGREALSERFNDAQRLFLKVVSNPSAPWMTIVTGHGYGAAQDVIRTLVESGGEARNGHVIDLADG